MTVGDYSKAGTISAHVSGETLETIQKRAESIGIKKGTYLALIVKQWIDRGCPPVSEPDRIIQIARRQETLLAAQDQAPYGKRTGPSN